MIPDLYVFYKEQEEKEVFSVKPQKDIEKGNLKNSPQHAMSIFIQKNFPTVWEADKNNSFKTT